MFYYIIIYFSDYLSHITISLLFPKFGMTKYNIALLVSKKVYQSGANNYLLLNTFSYW